MQSLRLVLCALPLTLVGAACSQTGPSLGTGTGGAGGGATAVGGVMVTVGRGRRHPQS